MERRKALKSIGAGASLLAATPVVQAATESGEKALHDKFAIREMVENWVLYRDAGDWERFRSVWHEDGYMMATWFQGTFEEFIKVSKDGFDKGVSILHHLGGTTIDIVGNRAVVQTKMQISQRAPVHDVMVDVLCTGRFYDFFEKRKGKWAIVLRRLTYEKDRMDCVDPSATVKLDAKLLEQFPPGYRNLGYLQTGIGYKVKTNLPGIKGPDTDRLYSYGKDWLAGKPATGFRA